MNRELGNFHLGGVAASNAVKTGSADILIWVTVVIIIGAEVVAVLTNGANEGVESSIKGQNLIRSLSNQCEAAAVFLVFINADIGLGFADHKIKSIAAFNFFKIDIYAIGNCIGDCKPEVCICGCASEVHIDGQTELISKTDNGGGDMLAIVANTDIVGIGMIGGLGQIDFTYRADLLVRRKAFINIAGSMAGSVTTGMAALIVTGGVYTVCVLVTGSGAGKIAAIVVAGGVFTIIPGMFASRTTSSICDSNAVCSGLCRQRGICKRIHSGSKDDHNSVAFVCCGYTVHTAYIIYPGC